MFSIYFNKKKTPRQNLSIFSLFAKTNENPRKHLNLNVVLEIG